MRSFQDLVDRVEDIDPLKAKMLNNIHSTRFRLYSRKKDYSYSDLECSAIFIFLESTNPFFNPRKSESYAKICKLCMEYLDKPLQEKLKGGSG